MGEIIKGFDNYKTQEFNGKVYYLYNGEKYFSKGKKRLHREVWRFHNGDIPKDYHIHHIDGDTHNNEINNLNLVHKTIHHKLSCKKRMNDNPDFYKEFNKKGREAAKDWHKSDEGIKWHKEHAKNSLGKLKLIEKKCEECGEIYKTKHPIRSRFCNQNCKQKARRKRLKNKS